MMQVKTGQRVKLDGTEKVGTVLDVNMVNVKVEWDNGDTTFVEMVDLVEA